FAHRLASELLHPRQRVVSSGYYPVAGRPSPEPAVAAAATLGVDLATHRSVRLAGSQIDEADAVFVFDLENYERVVADHRCGRKTHFVGSLGGGPLWVEDPYGRGIDDFLRTYERIRQLITTAIARPLPADGSPARG